MKNRNLPVDDNWITPAKVYDALNAEFKFDFDPCPYNPGEIVNDGLTIEWGKMNFVNPPYSRKLKEAFVHRGVYEASMGNRSVFLLPVSTGSILYHEVIVPNAREIRFIKGRIKFQKRDEKGELYTPKNGGMHDSMIVIL